MYNKLKEMAIKGLLVLLSRRDHYSILQSIRTRSVAMLFCVAASLPLRRSNLMVIEDRNFAPLQGLLLHHHLHCSDSNVQRALSIG
jgi:hypothetical protein